MNEDEPDMRGPAVICEGSVIGGFTFTGPFETMEAAANWHQEHSLPGQLGLKPCAIVLLEKPWSVWQ